MEWTDMRIDLSELSRSPGKSRDCSIRYERKAIDIGGTKYPVINAGDACFTLSCPQKGVCNLEGRYELEAMSQCDRCLKDVPVKLSVEISESFNAEETPEVDADELLDREFLIEWPAKVLCDPECKGICQICGKNLNDGSCGCGEIPADLRMAAVLDLFNSQKKEV